MKNIWQVIFYGLDNGGDKNGEIIEIGYFDNKQKAEKAIFRENFRNEFFVDCDQITENYARYKEVNSKNEPKGYYEVIKLDVNKTIDKQISY